MFMEILIVVKLLWDDTKRALGKKNKSEREREREDAVMVSWCGNTQSAL